MSQENEEILRRLFDAWNQHDFAGGDFAEGLLPYVAPDVELNVGLQPPGEETRFVGHAGVRDWVRNVADAWVAVTVERVETIEVESDRILSIDRWRFTGRDGIEITEALPTAYTFRDGLITRIDGFTDKSEALRAVGP